MAFPSSSTTTTADALKLLRDVAAQVRAQTVNVRNMASVDGLAAGVIINYMAGLRSAKTRMAAVAGTNGLAAYAQAQFGSAIDIVAEYAAMMSAIDATVAWIAANMPKDGSNFLLAQSIAADGTITDRTFTAAQLAGFRTVLDSLTATIG